MIISNALMSETTLEFCNYIICFELLKESFIDHKFQCFAYAARKSIKTVVVWVRISFPGLDIGIIVASFQDFGALSVSQMSYNVFNRTKEKSLEDV